MAQDLIEAIEDHLTRYPEYRMDHSLEPIGIRLSPSSINDIVFETIPDEEW